MHLDDCLALAPACYRRWRNIPRRTCLSAGISPDSCGSSAALLGERPEVPVAAFRAAGATVLHVDSSTTRARGAVAEEAQGRMCRYKPETLVFYDDPSSLSSRLANAAARLTFWPPEPAAQPAIHPFDQASPLFMCRNVRDISPTGSETSGSCRTSRALSHRKNWSVHTVALLLCAQL
ncbi:hypothetical protein FA95DRAFT_1078469 [Auriscalpium vulgare]|uniref:Uncharacterized protein n=1 Tax=Auriscalpium vulgare TaxID=40419 RepID=A0ACB8R5Q6_9AGAM|nr:hypothetical protein FA95DRAFT_1078469 [Auriscalpium vulgare]